MQPPARYGPAPDAAALPPDAAEAGVSRSAVRRRIAGFVELSKPRVVLMVALTTLAGFYLGSRGVPDLRLMLIAVLGTGLAAGGTLALNQYMERDLDARMERTRSRPLPSGRVGCLEAFGFGVLLLVAGLGLLLLGAGAPSALVTAITAGSYLLVYTPLKQRTSLCSLIGAVPGALPPVTGWVAARGEAGLGAWILFSIVFLWQLPHSLAIAKLYAEDYARAGFRLLPIVDPDGHSTERQIVNNCAALLVVALMPTLVGLAGPIYFVAALVLGAAYLVSGLLLARSGSRRDARHVLAASFVYLPLLLAIMAADKVLA